MCMFAINQFRNLLVVVVSRRSSTATTTTPIFSNLSTIRKLNSFPVLSVNCKRIQPSSLLQVSTMSSSTKFERLPKQVTPVNYNLTYEPNWVDHSFSASASIDVLVNEETSRVTLNAMDFKIKNISFLNPSNNEIKESNHYVLDNEQGILTIDFSQPLDIGKGILSIEFNGIVNDSLKGFFRSKYKSVDGQEKFHYVTKYEPAFARYCCPCWDEPAIKATFDITLIVPKELIAVSNMRSVKMSTYVMAFAIGEFDFIEARSAEGVLCRVYTPVGKKERGQYALGIVTKAITFYSEYFGIPYPLPKMDLLAVNEYPCGAMENWGLVIYKEVALLMDEKLSSTMNKQRVALTVTHETAHMWFGNLVTMEWWSDLWLNEGYASYMEYVCTSAIFPEYSVWESFVSDDVCLALDLDGLDTSHPIQVVVESPSSVGEIFDAISKGSAVIRMLHNYIGEDDFKKGMKLYLSKHQFGNAETGDLWAALTAASGKPVDKIMPTWTKQMGYPLLFVRDISQFGKEQEITITYQKFCTSIISDLANCQKKSWIIPINVRKQSEPNAICGVHLIDDKPTNEIKIRVNAKPEEWVNLNPDSIGYYRLTYSSLIREKFIESIKNKTMGPIDRLRLIDDLFACIFPEKSTSEEVLNLLNVAYRDEDNYTVWCVIHKIIGSFNVILSESKKHEIFQAFSISIFKNIATKLGWDPIPGESSKDSSLRTIILTRMIGLQHEPTVLEAKRRFDQHVKGEELLHPDIKSPVYRAVLNTEDASDNFDSLIKLYRESDLLEEKYSILRAFGSTRKPELIQRALEFGLSDDVNKQDICILMIYFVTKVGREAAWEFLKKSVKHFQTVHPSGGWYLRALVKIPANFTTQAKAEEVEMFFKENTFVGVDRAVQQTIESIKDNATWLSREQEMIEEYLDLWNENAVNQD